MGQNQAKQSYIPKPSRTEHQYLESMGFIVGPGKGFKYVKLTLPDGYKWKDKSIDLASGKREPRWYIVDPDGKTVVEYWKCYCGEGFQPNSWIDGHYNPEYFSDNSMSEESHNPEEEKGPMFRSKFGEVIYVNFVFKIWDIRGWS